MAGRLFFCNVIYFFWVWLGDKSKEEEDDRSKEEQDRSKEEEDRSMKYEIDRWMDVLPFTSPPAQNALHPSTPESRIVFVMSDSSQAYHLF
jgi:hypothetical protein